MKNNNDIRKSKPRNSQIVKYWKDKYMTPEFEITSEYNESYEPIVNDWGDPECFICGKYNEKIYENKKRDEYVNKEGKYLNMWNLEEYKKIIQVAHIVPKMLGGTYEESNLFLICEHCHYESPDFIEPKYFYMYFWYVRKNYLIIDLKRKLEKTKARYIFAKMMNKNILYLGDTFEYKKAGLHGSVFSSFTQAAIAIDKLPEIDEKTTKEELKQIEDKYNQINILIEQLNEVEKHLGIKF